MSAEGPEDRTGVQGSREQKEIQKQLLTCTWPPFVVNTLVVANVMYAEGTVNSLSASFAFCIIHRLARTCSLCEHTCATTTAAENNHVEYSSTQHHDRLAFQSCYTQRFIGYKPPYEGVRLRWTLTFTRFTERVTVSWFLFYVSGYIV